MGGNGSRSVRDVAPAAAASLASNLAAADGRAGVNGRGADGHRVTPVAPRRQRSAGRRAGNARSGTGPDGDNERTGGRLQVDLSTQGDEVSAECLNSFFFCRPHSRV